MLRDSFWDKLRPLRQALSKVRTRADDLRLPAARAWPSSCWKVTLRDGDREAGTHVEIVTYATDAEVAQWQRNPDAEIRGTGLTWRHAVPAKKLRRAA